jgi:hypothetical protein
MSNTIWRLFEEFKEQSIPASAGQQAVRDLAPGQHKKIQWVGSQNH